MLKLIAKIFGSKSEKDIKRMTPLVELAKLEGEKLVSISHDELRNKTLEIKEYINAKLKSIDDELAAFHQRIADHPELDIAEKESIFLQIDKTELERNKELETVLIEVLPQAFAIIRETSKRFKENDYLEVTATEFDRQLAAKHDNVKIVCVKPHSTNQCMSAGYLFTYNIT